MARLSQGLITGLANPAYANNLGAGIQNAFGSYEQSRKEWEAKREEENKRLGLESVIAQAASGDLSDPRVLKGMMSTATQTGLDPMQALQVSQQIQQSQFQRNAEDRAASAEAHATELRPFQIGSAKYNQWVQEAEKRDAAVKNIAASTFDPANPENHDLIKQQLPEEEQAVYQENIDRLQKNHLDMEKLRSDLAKNERLSPDALSTYAEVLGEDYIDTYNKRAEGPAGAAFANRQLQMEYQFALQNEYSEERAGKARLAAPMTKAEETRITEIVKDADRDNVSPGSDFDENTPAAIEAVKTAFRLGMPMSITSLEKVKTNLEAGRHGLDGLLSNEQTNMLKEAGLAYPGQDVGGAFRLTGTKEEMDAQFEKLAVGDKFIDPKGNLRVKEAK